MSKVFVGIILLCTWCAFFLLGIDALLLYSTAETIMQQIAGLVMLVSACVLWTGIIIVLVLIGTRRVT